MRGGARERSHARHTHAHAHAHARSYHIDPDARSDDEEDDDGDPRPTLSTLRRIVRVDFLRPQQLRSLRLRSCGIGDVGVEVLVAALHENTSLVELDLSSNGIGPYGANAVAEGIGSLGTLERLALAWNGISGWGAVVLMQKVGVHESLRVLDLSYNSLGKITERVSVHVAVGRALKENSTLVGGGRGRARPRVGSRGDACRCTWTCRTTGLTTMRAA